MRGLDVFGLQPKHYLQAKEGLCQSIVQPVYHVRQYIRESGIWRIPGNYLVGLIERASQEEEERKPLL